MATIEEVLNQAIAMHQAGQVQQAIPVYQKIIAATQEKHFVAMQLLGVAFGQVHRHPQAIEILQKAMVLDPDAPDAHLALANSFLATAQTDKAIPHLNKALAINPAMHQARLELAGIYEKQQQTDLAIEQYMHLLRHDPSHIACLNNLAGLLIQEGHFDQAAKHLDRVLEKQPNYLSAMCHQAMVYQAKGQIDQALELLNQAKTQHPSQIQPRYMLAVHYKQAGDLEQADEICTQIIALKPDHVDALVMRGEIQQAFNSPGQALTQYDQALQVCSETQSAAIRVKRALALPIVLHDVDQIRFFRKTLTQTLERLNLDQPVIANPLKSAQSMPLLLAYHGQNDKAIYESLAALYRKACPSLTWTAPHVTAQSNTLQTANRPIRLAMISKNLNNHTIGQFMLGIAEHLDTQDFELSIFHISNKTDEIATAINQHASFSCVLADDLLAARNQIASHQPDIVFYPDIGMEPMSYFLAFSRLAKVQCVWWGHPVTTGIPTLDYYVSSEKLEPPHAQEHYTEKLVRLPSFAMYSQKPLPTANLTPLSHWGITTENVNLYLCCQSLFKVHPDFDAVLLEILEKDANALLIFFQGEYTNWQEVLRNRWNDTIGPMGRRIIFLPRQPYPLFLELIQHAKVILDTLHFAGCNTTLQCLALGKPIITLPGPYMKSRITTAAYLQMGMTDLIAKNMNEYIRLAIKLGNDPAFNQACHQKIRAQNATLFANPQAVKELETFFKEAHQNTLRQTSEN